MPRYFIEVAYMGTHYAGSQRQKNANSIQAELETALKVYFRSSFELTGSSRTDAGVHALQNFYHFDTDVDLPDLFNNKVNYHLNAILPADIVVKSIKAVSADAHCRFDALSRVYDYTIYTDKDPFLKDRAFYYPFPIDMTRLNTYSLELVKHKNFETFAKKNSQVHTFKCNIVLSQWRQEQHSIIYRVEANRFLRGMVKGLVGTMLRSAQKGLTLNDFTSILESNDPTRANFAVPSHGLKLVQVLFNDTIEGTVET